MFRAALTLAGFNANYLDAKSTAPETLTQSRPTSSSCLAVGPVLLRAKTTRFLRWRLAIGRLPIGHAYTLKSAGIDPVTSRTQAQQNGERFALASRAMFADWLEKLRLAN